MLVIAIAPILWAKGVVAVIAFAATLPAVRVLSGPLRKLLTGEEELDTEQLINQIGETDVGEVRPDFGRALLRIEDQEHAVEVRCKEGTITPRGTKVRLLEYVPSGGFFWIERVCN
jgi:hypothetical protein